MLGWGARGWARVKDLQGQMRGDQGFEGAGWTYELRAAARLLRGLRGDSERVRQARADA